MLITRPPPPPSVATKSCVRSDLIRSASLERAVCESQALLAEYPSPDQVMDAQSEISQPNAGSVAASVHDIVDRLNGTEKTEGVSPVLQRLATSRDP